MKHLVKLQFNLIVETDDNATREEIIEQVRTQDLPEAIDDRDFEENNVISIEGHTETVPS